MPHRQGTRDTVTIVLQNSTSTLCQADGPASPPAVVTDLPAGADGSRRLMLAAVLAQSPTYYAAGEASRQLLPQTLTPLLQVWGSPTFATSATAMGKLGHQDPYIHTHMRNHKQYRTGLYPAVPYHIGPYSRSCT
jgi:hypothetical protein